MIDPGSFPLTFGPALLAAVMSAVGLKQLGWVSVGAVGGFAFIAGILAAVFSFVGTFAIGWAVSVSALVIVGIAFASGLMAAFIVAGSAALARRSAHG